MPSQRTFGGKGSRQRGNTPASNTALTFPDDFKLDPVREAQAFKALEESEAFKNRTAEITSFRVYSRVRPFIKEELAEMEGQEKRSIVEMVQDRTILLDPKDNWSPKAQYEFDASFWSIPPEHGLIHTFQDSKRKDFASQRMVYEKVAKDLVPHAFKGYNSCILTYGQTGSGKTYTIMGEYDPRVPCGGEGREGIIPRISYDLFAQLAVEQERERKEEEKLKSIHGEAEGAAASSSQPSRKHQGPSLPTVRYRVEVSFVEIYMERVRDLLDPALRNAKGSDRLSDARIRQDPYGGPFVEGVTKYQVENWGQCCILLERGSQHRTTCATAVHQQSSRSHAIYQLTVIRETTTPQKGRYDRPTVSTQSGRINLVDLAGSERGGAQPYVKESAAINTSLLALRRCIDALTERQNVQLEQLRLEITEGRRANDRLNLPQVPFRESVLTWLLSDSIGGNARTSMIATLSPLVKNYSDTQATLQWSSKARNLVALVKVNDQAVVQGGLSSQRGQLGTEVMNTKSTLDSLRATLKQKQAAAEKLAKDVVAMQKNAATADKRTTMMLREMAAIIIQRAFQAYIFRGKHLKLLQRKATLEGVVAKVKAPENLVVSNEEAMKKQEECTEKFKEALERREAAAAALKEKEDSRTVETQRRFAAEVENDRIRRRLLTEIEKESDAVTETEKGNDKKKITRVDVRRLEQTLDSYRLKVEESKTKAWKEKYDVNTENGAASSPEVEALKKELEKKMERKRALQQQLKEAGVKVG